ncbi:hypothetical protein OPV22_005699 [Ensete ventricosum]|uniref:Uncharacterized protein n=1 Tax=Ensete ventricosum TaxID=4639 RepID=A0AAV8RH77_ENSVE|nr:hypothetical protein OPV22_005699 [Ensete ventricosum]
MTNPPRSFECCVCFGFHQQHSLAMRIAVKTSGGAEWFPMDYLAVLNCRHVSRSSSSGLNGEEPLHCRVCQSLHLDDLPNVLIRSASFLKEARHRHRNPSPVNSSHPTIKFELDE